MKNEQINTINQQGLSKRERRQLKKEQKRLRRIREIRRKRLVKWGSFLGVIILLVGGFFLFKYAKAKRYENASKIQVTPITHNFGKIPASEGAVEAVFEVKNVGALPLLISGMETSCGCTTAKLKSKDQESNTVESPKFGMHNNPTDWSISIEPGITVELAVTFDPNFHKNSFGPVTRTISIFSNDPGKSEEKVTILANVI